MLIEMTGYDWGFAPDDSSAELIRTCFCSLILQWFYQNSSY